MVLAELPGATEDSTGNQAALTAVICPLIYKGLGVRGQGWLLREGLFQALPASGGGGRPWHHPTPASVVSQPLPVCKSVPKRAL